MMTEQSTPDALYFNARALAEYARQGIEAAGETQAQAAARLGVSTSAINQAVNYDPAHPLRMTQLRAAIMETYYPHLKVEDDVYFLVRRIEPDAPAGEA